MHGALSQDVHGGLVLPLSDACWAGDAKTRMCTWEAGRVGGRGEEERWGERDEGWLGNSADVGVGADGAPNGAGGAQRCLQGQAFAYCGACKGRLLLTVVPK